MRTQKKQNARDCPAVIDQIFVQNRDFCRAMLCISAAYAVAQCPDVRLSVTFMYFAERNLQILFHCGVAKSF